MNNEELLARMRSGEIPLKPSQSKVSFPVIARIHKKMSLGLRFKSLQVAKDAIIVDGHHRYLASLFAKIDLEKAPYPLSPAKVVTEWETVELIDSDYDSQDDILKFNEDDAKFNDMTLQTLMELLA